ncbi:MAG: hypothetical protein CVV27_04645 [Candidatus Melainabacteria bacterium HGW-Melainabacteria-1]|nr:MAG: hypothetical protein CVV27_04645 [Candidatus Melainabacteria bacterium HGW-Melainabacteria-1]
MALDLSLISAHDIIRQRHADQQDVIQIFAAPLSQLNTRELEEARLMLLDSLFESNSDSLTGGISYAHYHLPILMCATEPAHATPLLQAWTRSGLFLSYNLVLLVPESADPSCLAPLLEATPDAINHLCLRSLERNEAQLLMEAVTTYLPVQEPHLYLSLQASDTQLLEAMASGLLGLSLYPRLGLRDGHNGFLLEGLQPRTLAFQLIDLLEDPERDWEILQEIAQRGQQMARRELRS